MRTVAATTKSRLKRRKLHNSTDATNNTNDTHSDTVSGALPPNGDTAREPGKIHTNGRQAALQRLDSMMADPTNLEKLGSSMQEKFDDDPLAFFRNVTVPLISKTMIEGQTDEDPMRIRNELRAMKDSIATEPEVDDSAENSNEGD